MLIEAQHDNLAYLKSKNHNTDLNPQRDVDGKLHEKKSTLIPDPDTVGAFDSPPHLTHEHLNGPQSQALTVKDSSTRISLNPTSPPGLQTTNGKDILPPNGGADFLKNMYRGSCQAWCSCRCHHKLRCHSRAGTMSPLGFLFMCLSGGRYSLQSCNEPRCLRKQELKMKLAFVFPPWLLAQAICFMLTISCLGTPKFTPRWSATFSGDAKVFTCAIEGDLDGLKKLFEKRAASPHDVANSTGRTALHVSLLFLKVQILFAPLSRRSVCCSVQSERGLPLPA